MTDIAVPIALFLVQRVLSSLDQVPRQKKVRGEVQDVADSLKAMQAYLGDMGVIEGSQVLLDRVKQVRDIAFDTENVLEEIMLHLTHRYHGHKISKVTHELVYSVTDQISVLSISPKITDIKSRIDRITALDQLRGGGGTGFTIPGEGTSSSPRVEQHLITPYVGDDYEIVGFEELTEKLMYQLKGSDQLKGTEPRQKTISLVGLGGSGKSVLAMKVYSMTRCERLFDCYAWVSVSQSFKIEEILCSLLTQFCASMYEPIPHDSANTQVKLRNYLQQKRYIAVLDDIWSKKDWESIQNALPTGSCGSRIVVTTRNKDVASFCSDMYHIHNLDGLSEPEAWHLFCRKAFHADKCPPALVDLSEKIVTRCECIPHAIVAVGTILSKKQQTPTEWQKMHDNIVSGIGTDSSLSIFNKLLPSYKDLPWYLRCCFLYFSIFPEDYAIDRGRLIRLWIAEGFVMKPLGNKTLEEVAEDYLNELVGRNLVLVRTWELDGRVRDCRVLNFVLEFIILKSVEENFMSNLVEPRTSSTEKVRRLSIQNALFILKQNRDLSSVRSTFFFKADDISPSEITRVLRAFKLLRVLDLRDFPLDEFPEDIFHLILLRYLCLRNTKIKKVPNSIKKLSHLETLDLKQTNVTKLPKGILQLLNLRHLLVNWCNVKNYVTWDSVKGVEMAGGIGALTNLHKLSLVKSDKLHKIVKELGALTQLRKLGLIELKREGGRDLCASVQKMEKLSTLDVSSTSKHEFLDLDDMPNPPPYLQRLYLKGQLQLFPGWISKLDNLFKIGLKWSRLESSPLEGLQELPNLMELEMVDAFTGGELVFEAGKFKKLKILHIEQFDQLHTVVVGQGAMPELQKLTLCKCVKLEMLPLGIDQLTHIEELLMYDMPVEFTRRLGRSNVDHEMVHHIPIIQSFILGHNGSWSRENLS